MWVVEIFRSRVGCSKATAIVFPNEDAKAHLVNGGREKGLWFILLEQPRSAREKGQWEEAGGWRDNRRERT